MNQLKHKLGGAAAALTLALMAGGTAIADDTELFVAGGGGQDSPEFRPNILFVIDTSGSMRSTVMTQEDWDPDTTFEGCYRSDSVYWSTTDQPPACGSDRRYRKWRNLCDASLQPLDAFGVYQGNLLAWFQHSDDASKNKWLEFDEDKRDRYLECEADAGVHSFDGDDYDRFWASDGTSFPYRTDDTSEPAWNFTYYLWDGNWLNWVDSDGTVESTRIDVVKKVTDNLLENMEGVNVGLMRFNFEDGGPVIHAMENIETARDEIRQTVQNLPANNWTPLSETLYEAGQYYAGRAVVYGDGYTNNSVPESRVGGTSSSGAYNSPIDFTCQKNYVVLLTDGYPTRDTGAESSIEALPGFAAATGSAECSILEGDNNPDGTENDGKCLDEMAGYMFNHDMSPLEGEQNVATYTIGFAIDLPLLKATAEKGGGEYYTADDTGTLSAALSQIVIDILDKAGTFTAPSVPVNAFNRTQDLDHIYLSLFSPSSTVNWPGNVKKYKLQGGKLVDVHDEPAVNPATGFFDESAQSFWSSEADGNIPSHGGAAEQLPDHASRKLYTNIAGGDLNGAGNAVATTNAAITGPMLGASPSTVPGGDGYTERERIIQWMRGEDVFDEDGNENTETRRKMGDPLHVKPVPIIYGGTAQDPDMVIYITTNEGYMHAIDPETGEELWAFVPETLLESMNKRHLNRVSPKRVYGLDGEITATIINDDRKGGITGSERVILTFGMRRGGDSIFAVEVTDRNDPQLLWEINAQTAGFEDLGQTWSTPQNGRVKIGGDVHDVLFFGGGYDPGQDSNTVQEDSYGNAVYMVDTVTGELLWSAGDDSNHDLQLDEFRHSVPAPLRLVDMNADGLVSRLYFGDMGGRIWKIDLLNGNDANDFAHGGIIASLGAADMESPGAADLRRFYNQVDVVNALIGGKRFMAVNVGSGYRAHPLDRNIDEHFFVIRDYDVNTVVDTAAYPGQDDRLKFADLDDVDGDTIDIYSSPGWKLALDAASGEKSLSRSVTFDGTIFFTTFAPSGANSACSVSQGNNRLYALSLFGGNTLLDDDAPYILLKQPGIAPQVELIYVAEDVDGDGIEDGKLTALVGSESIDLDFINPVNRTYWTQDGAQ